MTANSIAMTIRAKKLGVLIRDARLAAGRSLEASAQALGIPAATFEAYEWGEASPSLPELELLAFFFKVPLDHFWGNKAISTENSALEGQRRDQLVALRQRKIGASLRQARLNAGASLEELADRAGISPSELETYEFGERPIPLPLLEALSSALNRPVQDFQDFHGPVGAWIAQRQAERSFGQVPAELQSFVSKPTNRPYLEVARRLSEMSADKLRAVAEGLLEITF